MSPKTPLKGHLVWEGGKEGGGDPALLPAQDSGPTLERGRHFPVLALLCGWRGTGSV